MKKVLLVFMCMLAVFCFLACVSTLTLSFSDPVAPVEYTAYTVRSGDTLWGIASAESNGAGSMKVQYIIEEIKSANGCGSVIYPGQVLQIPQY